MLIHHPLTQNPKLSIQMRLSLKAYGPKWLRPQKGTMTLVNFQPSPGMSGLQ